jgi:3-oxoacyl-[acyl-carrier protein] reductase
MSKKDSYEFTGEEAEMDLKIKGKSAVVTGGGKGIGRACALALAKEGTNVCINDLDPETGNETLNDIKALGVKGAFVKGDVTKEADIKTLFKIAKEELGAVDILINNAGISPKLPFYEITTNMWEQVLNTNLKSNFMCSKEAFSYMKEHDWGRIVSLSSLAGVHGGINSAAHYSASKAGIIGLTKTLAKQVGKYNITVNCVAPGRIDTAMTRMLSKEKLDEVLSRIPLKRLGTVEEVAEVITFLASEGGSYITGTCVEILGGYTG